MGKSNKQTMDPALVQANVDMVKLQIRQYEDYIGEGGDQQWMRGVADQALGISKQQADNSQRMTDYQLEQMQYNDDRYRNVAIPYEDKLLEDTERFDSAEYKQGLVNSAVSDVSTMADNTQAQMQRGMTRMGVNPNSGAFGAMANSNSLSKASAMASAANKTRMAADQVGLSTKMQMYGGMKGLAGLGATNASLASGAMGMGLNSAQGMTGAASSSLNANNAAANTASGGVTSGVNSGVNIMNAQSNAMGQDSTGSILGAVGGIGMAI